MEPPARKRPKRKEHRVILQFDYDCFYAQVAEHQNPSLKSKPVGIKQKNILATCNYNARAMGARKLMLISEAKKICPGLVLVDGEDLTAFRDASKVLFSFLKSFSWNKKAERLGFDEVFLDVTDIVEYNLSCINKSALSTSFFYLSRKDPEIGFECDLSSIAGCVSGDKPATDTADDLTYVRLLLGSHLAMHLRTRLETEYGYTSTCGIATNKALSKLAGAKHKPKNQTTLLSLSDEAVSSFMDGHKLRQVPGLGFKMVQLIESHITKVQQDIDITAFDSVLTVGEVRTHPDMSAAFLEKLLAGPGAEKGVGARIWGLLHGVDVSEVKETNYIPAQISIEDTYKGLESLPSIAEELFKLSCSLIRRMRIDLLPPSYQSVDRSELNWLARPKTLRLSVKWWSVQGPRHGTDSTRISRSSSLPAFVFDTDAEMEVIASRLVAEALLPLIRRIQSDQIRPWNLQLVNVCVTNMVASAADDKNGVGRDISVMFKRQDEALRPWKVLETPSSDAGESKILPLEPDIVTDGNVNTDSEGDETPGWETSAGEACNVCGSILPSFAAAAHQLFHEMEGPEPKS